MQKKNKRREAAFVFLASINEQTLAKQVSERESASLRVLQKAKGLRESASLRVA